MSNQRPLIALLPAVALVLGLANPGFARVYEAIRDESVLTYRIKHPLHKVKGVTREFTCKVELSPDTLSSKVEVSADVKTFDSGNSNRDDHVLEAVKARKHPRVEFVSDSVRKSDDGYRVFGKLTFAGKTRPVDFAVIPKHEGGKVRIAGGFTVKPTDYGVKPPSLMFIAAEDKLDIRFDLVAKEE